MTEEEYVINEDSFQFVNNTEKLHDTKLETKRVGYLKDAFRRFCKNKGSVVAACIILLLVLFAIFSPVISSHDLLDTDIKYKDRTPLIRGNETGGFLDGGKTRTVSEAQYLYYMSIGADTGFNPITKLYNQTSSLEGKAYKVRINTYYEIGAHSASLTKQEFQDIIAFQKETGIQVLLPYVEDYALGNGYTYESYLRLNELKNSPNATIRARAVAQLNALKTSGRDRKNRDSNICFRYDSEGNPVKENGQYVMSYSYLDDALNGNFYYDNEGNLGTLKAGELAYGKEGPAIEVRLNYYNYYYYQRGETPQYIFGTDTFGKDIFYALGSGARFSLLLAIGVSVIRFIIGMFYGAIEGYYGGAADMIMERVSDILSGVPLMIVVTLFNLHLAKKVGIVPAFLLAFVVTGWIGTAALVRKQFYRFKGQEYVLAARTLGAGDFRIMFKHIFPNSLGTIVTSTVLVIPGVIGSETMLTYLGIVNLSSGNLTSIGALMASANGTFSAYPHELFFPAVYLSLLMICFNLFGNGLRDAFNPALRGSED